MPENLHDYLNTEIARNTAQHTVVIQELMDLLQLSKSSAYKKIKGEVTFSANELLAIAGHYDISLDHFVHKGKGGYEKLQFDYSLPAHLARNPTDFIEKVRADIEQIVQVPNPSMIYATNEVPLFHTVACRNLLAFKLYVWSRTNWKLPEALERPFDPDRFYYDYPAVEEHRLAILDAWMRIPGKEFWPRLMLDNILNQIKYYRDAQLFSDDSLPLRICEELMDLLESRSEMAANGNKGLLADGQAGATFELYLNEIAYTNTIILILSGATHRLAYTTVDIPNFLRSTDPVFCERMQQWIYQIEACSFPADKEQHRLSLFNDLKGRVARLAKSWQG